VNINISHHDLFKIYNPQIYKKYLRSIFKYKEADCLTLIKNYYLNELKQTINVDKIYDIFEEKLHYSDLSSITKENFIVDQNFQQIETKNLKIQANSLIDLSAQIKAESENMLRNKYFHPEEIKLDLNQYSQISKKVKIFN
jgi:hypothetical protein